MTQDKPDKMTQDERDRMAQVRAEMVMQGKFDRLLKVTDVADMLDVHKDTVLEWLRIAILPGFKLPGGAWRIHERDFIAWLEQLRAESQEQPDKQTLKSKRAKKPKPQE